jgi:rhombotail lipoprotein
MQQVARLYGVDVMALVSYDQVSISSDTKASVLYWTIIGAYLVEGTENDVQTFVDTAVFDVATRKLLFRAPGIDKRESRSTAVESSEELREERAASFSVAMADMTANLSKELAVFEDRLESDPQLAEVNWDESKGGAGSFGALTIFVLVFAAFYRQTRRHLAEI